MIEPVLFLKKGTPATPTEGAMALPAGSGAAPGIIVVHEFFGLNEHIRSITARLADEGFIALAVDLYAGQVTGSPERAMELVQAMKTGTSMEVIGGAAQALLAHPRCSGKIGITGFCLGGAMALAAACNVEEIAAAVPFYGLPVAQYADFSKAHAPIQGHFAERDQHVQKERVLGVLEKAQAAGLSVENFFYEGGHGFMRDSDPSAYHEASAKLAWGRMVAFFRQHLAAATPAQNG